MLIDGDHLCNARPSGAHSASVKSVHRYCCKFEACKGCVVML